MIRARGNLLREAMWLTWSDARRTPLSYVAAGLWPLLIGPLAASMLSGVFVVEGLGAEGERMEAMFNGALLDFWFLAIVPAFCINLLFNPDYSSRFTTDSMSRRMSFLRSIPVPIPVIVTGRMLTMLATLLVSAPPFFMAFYLSGRGSEGMPAGTAFAAFALIWIGYALLAGGFYMYVWLGVAGRTDLAITLSVAAAYLLTSLSVNLFSDAGLVERTVMLAREYGSISGIAALTSGGVAFVAWGCVTARRLGNRDLSL